MMQSIRHKTYIRQYAKVPTAIVTHHWAKAMCPRRVHREYTATLQYSLCGPMHKENSHCKHCIGLLPSERMHEGYGV